VVADEKVSLSVIVPVYNSGDYLQICLESLVAQDCKGVEYICVDDGSTDGSGEKLDALAATDSRFKVIHQENGGYGKAMNAGLAAAKGKYIGIVEPDDWVAEGMFSKLLALAQKSNADMVKGDYCGESVKYSRPGRKYKHLSEDCVYRPEEVAEVLEGSVAIWAGIYKRELIEQHRIRFSETPRASYQDLGFGMRTWALSGSIAITPQSLYHYREDNPNSSVRRMEEGAWAVVKEVELQQDLFEQLADSKTRRSLLIRRVFHSFRADYRHRICETGAEYLEKCSALLQRLCPLPELDKSCFSQKEWRDIVLMYESPHRYAAQANSYVNWLQRLFSVRKESGKRVLRVFGLRINLS